MGSGWVTRRWDFTMEHGCLVSECKCVGETLTLLVCVGGDSGQLPPAPLSIRILIMCSSGHSLKILPSNLITRFCFRQRVLARISLKISHKPPSPASPSLDASVLVTFIVGQEHPGNRAPAPALIRSRTHFPHQSNAPC